MSDAYCELFQGAHQSQKNIIGTLMDTNAGTGLRYPYIPCSGLGHQFMNSTNTHDRATQTANVTG